MASNLKRFNDEIVRKDSMQKYLTQVLGKKKDSFITSLTSLVANSQSLQDCEPSTIMFAATKAAALGLPFDPNLGMAYCIPYNNRKENKKEAQFQIGYKGIVQLALRSGQIKKLNVTEVKDGEFLGEDLMTGDIHLTRIEDRESKPTIGYAAYIQLTNGFEKSIYWTKEQCEKHAMRYSQTYASKSDYIKSSSKWTTDFDAMAKKTILKQLLTRYAPMSVDMQDGIKSDQAVIHIDEDGNEVLDYVDNNNNHTDFSKVAEAAIAEEIKDQPTQADGTSNDNSNGSNAA